MQMNQRCAFGSTHLTLSVNHLQLVRTGLYLPLPQTLAQRTPEVAVQQKCSLGRAQVNTRREFKPLPKESWTTDPVH